MSTGAAEQGDAPDLSAPAGGRGHGRGSRLDRWLPDLADGDVEEVDARVGYAGRLYQQSGSIPLRTGVMVFGRAEDGASGLALPWKGAGGSSPPPVSATGGRRGAGGLRDLPRLAARSGHHRPRRLPRAGERGRRPPPDRQPSTRLGSPPRLAAGAARGGRRAVLVQPDLRAGHHRRGLQAEALGRWLSADRRIDHRLNVSCARSPICPGRSRPAATGDSPAPPHHRRRASVVRLHDADGSTAAAGNARVTRAFVDVYHLMASPAAFLHPALLLAASRPLPTLHAPPRRARRATRFGGSSHRRPEQTPDVIEAVASAAVWSVR